MAEITCLPRLEARAFAKIRFMDVRDRILARMGEKRIRNAKHLHDVLISKGDEVSYATVKNWVKKNPEGRSAPSTRHLKLLADVLETSPEYLLVGSGGSSSPQADLLPEDERRVVEQYRYLRDVKQLKVEEAIDRMSVPTKPSVAVKSHIMPDDRPDSVLPVDDKPTTRSSKSR